MAMLAGSSRWKNRDNLLLAAVLIVTAIACSAALGNGFALDDEDLVVGNVALGNWSFPLKALTHEEFWFTDASYLPHARNYRPLLLIWFWLDYHLFGLHAPFWHASILVVHLLAVWLVFKIARELTSNSNCALLAALLFGIIPVHAQALAWTAASGLVIGTTLELAAFYLIMKPRRDARATVLAGALYAPALLCHESVAVFPALVALYAFVFGRSRADGPSESAREPAMTGVLRAVTCAAPFAIEVLGYLPLLPITSNSPANCRRAAIWRERNASSTPSFASIRTTATRSIPAAFSRCGWATAPKARLKSRGASC